MKNKSGNAYQVDVQDIQAVLDTKDNYKDIRTAEELNGALYADLLRK